MTSYIKRDGTTIITRHYIIIVSYVIKFILTLLIANFLLIVYYQVQNNISDSMKFYVFFPLIFGLVNYAFIKLILSIISYFGDLIIISKQYIIIIKSTLFLQNDIEIIDARRVVKIDSYSHGFFSNILGFGKVVIEQQKDEVRTFHMIPDPQRLTSILKDHTKEITSDIKQK